MLLRFATMAAAVLAFSAAPPLPNSTAAASASAADPLTPYERCRFEAYYGCFPRDQYGNIFPPDLGNPEVQAEFEICYANALDACESLYP